MTVGDLDWVELPARDGHAQLGRRPAIILQSTGSALRSPTVLVVPLTSRLEALRFPGTLLVEPDAENALTRPSVALVFQLTAIDKRGLRGRLGRLSRPLLAELWSIFDEITDRKG